MIKIECFVRLLSSYERRSEWLSNPSLVLDAFCEFASFLVQGYNLRVYQRLQPLISSEVHLIKQKDGWERRLVFSADFDLEDFYELALHAKQAESEALRSWRIKCNLLRSSRIEMPNVAAIKTASAEDVIAAVARVSQSGSDEVLTFAEALAKVSASNK